MVGEDDHKSLEEQQAKEQEEDEELRRQLEDMDTTWETKKSREQELKDRKRREEGSKIVWRMLQSMGEDERKGGK